MLKTTLLAAGLLALSPAAAAAAERHVALTGTDNPSCSAAAPCKSVQHAVDLAAAGDTVTVGPGTFPGPVIVGKPLTLQGAGSNATRIERQTSGAALALHESVTVRGLKVAAGDGSAVYIPNTFLPRTIALDDVSAHAPGDGYRALDVRYAAGPLNLTVTGGEFSGDYGVELGRGAVALAGTRIDATERALGLEEGVSLTIADAHVSGRFGAQLFGASLIAHRTRFAGATGGLDVHSSEAADGSAALADSVVTTTSDYWTTRVNAVYAGRSTTLHLVRSTVVGPDATGVSVRATGGTASATLRNTVVLSAEHELSATGEHATIAAHSSAFAAAVAGQGATITAPGTNGNIAADPALALDLSPMPGSPLIDAGDPADIPAGTLDLDGRARVTDGDGDGAARPDIGAIERAGVAPQSPPPPAEPPAPATDTTAPVLGARADRRGRVHVELSEPATLRLTARRMRAGRRKGGRCVAPAKAPAGRRCARLGKRVAVRATGTTVLTPALKRGRYRITLVATDAAGNRSKPVTVTVRR